MMKALLLAGIAVVSMLFTGCRTVAVVDSPGYARTGYYRSSNYYRPAYRSSYYGSPYYSRSRYYDGGSYYRSGYRSGYGNRYYGSRYNRGYYGTPRSGATVVIR